MRAMPTYVTDYDDSFDNTFASWVFAVPDQWKSDYDKILSGDLKSISPEYRAELYRVFPKLSDKFDEIFKDSDREES